MRESPWFMQGWLNGFLAGYYAGVFGIIVGIAFARCSSMTNSGMLGGLGLVSASCPTLTLRNRWRVHMKAIEILPGTVSGRPSNPWRSDR